MNINSSIKKYQVYFKDDLGFISELQCGKQTFFVIDQKVYELYQELFKDIEKEKIYLIQAQEENKTIDTVLEICEESIKLNAKRNMHLISIGGGITQDITGFAANVLYRGIHWTFIPTTLLAACDSCIGGKTSLNYKHYKNLLGTFFPPDDIYICPYFFDTLSEKDFNSGLGEVVKFNIMRGEERITQIEQDLPKMLALDQKVINDYVKTSLEFKKDFVEQDEFDRGRRVLLNFAHTFGHAIESITSYDIPHGAAVALGTLMANYVSWQRGYISGGQQKRIENIIRNITSDYVLKDNFNLSNVLQAMKKDKKQTDEHLTVVLFVNDRLQLKICHDLQKTELEKAINYIKHFLNGEA